MKEEQLLEALLQGKTANGGSELDRGMHAFAERAMSLTAELNISRIRAVSISEMEL